MSREAKDRKGSIYSNRSHGHYWVHEPPLKEQSRGARKGPSPCPSFFSYVPEGKQCFIKNKTKDKKTPPQTHNRDGINKTGNYSVSSLQASFQFRTCTIPQTTWRQAFPTNIAKNSSIEDSRLCGGSSLMPWSQAGLGLNSNSDTYWLQLNNDCPCLFPDPVPISWSVMGVSTSSEGRSEDQIKEVSGMEQILAVHSSLTLTPTTVLKSEKAYFEADHKICYEQLIGKCLLSQFCLQHSNCMPQIPKY